MERLTFEGHFCDIAQCDATLGGSFCEDGTCSARKVWERLKAYEDTGLTPEEVLPKKMADEVAMKLLRLADLESFAPYKRLRKLAESDKDGRIVVLPCKVGDTVWVILDDKKYACKCMVEFVNIGGLGPTFVLCKVDGLREQYGVTSASFGKTVFLAKDEAEKALRRAENG